MSLARRNERPPASCGAAVSIHRSAAATVSAWLRWLVISSAWRGGCPCGADGAAVPLMEAGPGLFLRTPLSCPTATNTASSDIPGLRIVQAHPREGVPAGWQAEPAGAVPGFGGYRKDVPASAVRRFRAARHPGFHWFQQPVRCGGTGAQQTRSHHWVQTQAAVSLHGVHELGQRRLQAFAAGLAGSIQPFQLLKVLVGYVVPAELADGYLP